MQRKLARIPIGMRPGARQLNEASLLVAMTEAVPQNMRPMMREIVDFFVPAAHRNKKLGTMLLNMVCQEADANGITLLLTAKPYQVTDGPTPEKLVSWYGKFGFEILQQTPAGPLMARQVRDPQRLVH